MLDITGNNQLTKYFWLSGYRNPVDNEWRWGNGALLEPDDRLWAWDQPSGGFRETVAIIAKANNGIHDAPISGAWLDHDAVLCDIGMRNSTAIWVCACACACTHTTRVNQISLLVCHPWYQGSWGQHGAHLGPTGPRWASWWSHEPCYLGWSCSTSR